MYSLTITAIILQCLRPHHKVHMYPEIEKVKKMTIAQYDNNINIYFDTIKSLKLQIDSEDEMAYTNDAFVCDIFAQLKNEMLPSDFKQEFPSLERHWQMDKEIVSSLSLMDDDSRTTHILLHLVIGKLKSANVLRSLPSLLRFPNSRRNFPKSKAWVNLPTKIRLLLQVRNSNSKTGISPKLIKSKFNRVQEV
jgi:hypothetical protein